MHQDEVREKIRVSQILTRLSSHVEGATEMSSTQVKAAEILLRKSLPDLSQVEIQGEGGGPLKITIASDDSAVV